MERNRAICGLDLAAVTDIRISLDLALASGYEFICVPIVHTGCKKEVFISSGENRLGPSTRSDLVLTSAEWRKFVVGKLTAFLDMESKDVGRQKTCKLALSEELTYYKYLDLPAVLIKLNRPNNTNLAQMISSNLACRSKSVREVLVQIPMTALSAATYYYRQTCENQPKPNTWEWWNSFRSLCNFNSKLRVALEITEDLPSDRYISLWLGEPVKCLIIPTEIFQINDKGFKVLPEAHENVIKAMIGINVRIVVTGVRRYESRRHYVEYLDHLWKQSSIVADPIHEYARGFEEYVSFPLQPLQDNVTSATYEGFEEDPVKYSEYEKAIYMALIDRVPFAEKETNVQIVMVVGAGRGPLVDAAINAAKESDRHIRIYAVEKNPNAIVTLESKQEKTWHNLVKVVSCDMRSWEPPELADILVSELLGAFGDNELSPECLDGVQKCLKENGISIPKRYTSHLRPIQSSKLYNEVLQFENENEDQLACLETPYVTLQKNCFAIASCQPVFTFIHPKRDKMNDNTRYVTLTFDVEVDSVLHGFAAYFDTVLYENRETEKLVFLSIVPETHSRGMFSWFPIFFPIKAPMHLKSGQKLVVHFWRLTDGKNVWYEWAISSPVPLGIHNLSGRSFKMGL